MTSYKTHVYLITALTHMHVGSGAQNYGIIDNLVQRDPLTRYPFIHAPSLKGALREHCTRTQMDGKAINHIFGNETKKNDANNGAGKYIFNDAALLSLPVRSDKKPFFRATCPAIAASFLAALNQSGGVDIAFPENSDALHFENGTAVYTLENTEITATKARADLPAGLAAHLGSDVVWVTNAIASATLKNLDYPEDLFGVLCDDYHLPVMARNSLTDGKSNNLWYEQIVPRQTRFYFTILTPDEEYQEVFDNAITSAPVQIGANASIGYGQCTIVHLLSY